ncbi:hypothetical protein EJB05_00189, partial [Eragrostis curvula]
MPGLKGVLFGHRALLLGYPQCSCLWCRPHGAHPYGKAKTVDIAPFSPARLNDHGMASMELENANECQCPNAPTH